MAVAEPNWTGNGADWPEPGRIYQDPVAGAVVLVLTAPKWPGALRCGGAAMVAAPPLPCRYHSRPGFGAVLWPGRRYRDLASGLEVRCLRAGGRRLTYAGQTLVAVPGS
jgi:hypothetical protein